MSGARRRTVPWEFDRDQVNALNVELSNFRGDEAQNDARREGCKLAKALVPKHAVQVAIVAEELERRSELLAGDVARLLAAPLFHR
jgi:hypothetical protein